MYMKNSTFKFDSHGKFFLLYQALMCLLFLGPLPCYSYRMYALYT